MGIQENFVLVYFFIKSSWNNIQIRVCQTVHPSTSLHIWKPNASIHALFKFFYILIFSKTTWQNSNQPWIYSLSHFYYASLSKLQRWTTRKNSIANLLENMVHWNLTEQKWFLLNWVSMYEPESKMAIVSKIATFITYKNIAWMAVVPGWSQIWIFSCIFKSI